MSFSRRSLLRAAAAASVLSLPSNEIYAAMQTGDVQLTAATTQGLFTWMESQSGNAVRRLPTG